MWVSGGNVNTARRGHLGLGTSHAAAIAAGYSTGFIQTTEKYDGTTWSAGNNIGTTAQYGAAAIGTQTAGLKGGGNSNGSATGTTTTEKYDGTTWSASVAMDTARVAAAACGTQTAALISGGLHTPNILSSSSYWNNTSWVSAGAMPAVKNAHISGGTQSSGYAIAGDTDNTDGSQVATVFTYNGSSWSTGTACGTAARHCGGGGGSSSILKHGGGATATPITTSELWNGTTWTTTDSMSAARNYQGAAGDAYYGLAIAGYTGAANLGSTERYNYNYSWGGGFIAGGTTLSIKASSKTMVGGLVVGGSSSYRVPVYRTSMSGGAVIGGASGYHLGTYRTTMSGGAILGGNSPSVFTSVLSQDITWGVWDNNNNPITGGAANTSIKARRVTDNNLLDWNDLAFKDTGWGAVTALLAEISATSLAGYYHKSVYVGTWADGWYQFFVRYTGSPVQNGDIEMYVKDGKVLEVRAGENLDAPVSGVVNGVWSKALETLTAEEMMRIILAALAGKRAGLGTATENYMDRDGVKSRITFVPTDANGNGTPTLDGTP